MDNPLPVYLENPCPPCLLFNEDLDASQRTFVLLMHSQLATLAGNDNEPRKLLAIVLERDPTLCVAIDIENDLRERAGSDGSTDTCDMEPLLSCGGER